MAPWEELVRRHGAACVDPDGRPRADGDRPAALLPGSFNPLHEGHLALARVASARLGTAVAFELSIANVDKPALPAAEVERRLGPLREWGPVWITAAPTFFLKARLFPGCVFVLGFDTAVRLVSPAYYENDPTRRDAALRSIAGQGCRFLVGGRLDAAGEFRTWEEDGLAPAEFAGLFRALSRDDFRVDVSSTDLRSREKGAF